MSDVQRKQLTFYVTLLFNRTEARRYATGHLHQVTEHAIEKFLSNEVQLLTVAANWNIDLLLSGRIATA
jgi:phage FluMu gp28-like protein